jgi:hypothetical protein
MKYRKKPVVVEAWQFTDENKERLLHDLQTIQMNISHTWDKENKPALLIPTLEGEMIASLNDWIIKGINGEFYPCKPDIFDKTYEPVIE